MPDPVDLDALEALAGKASPGPWSYDGYSTILSAQSVQADEAFWTEDREKDNHTYEHRVGEICPACGERPAIGSDGKRYGTYWDCAHWTEAYEAEARRASVPAHHGDTAIGQRKADAEFIAAAREAVPWLIGEVRRLRAEADQYRPIGWAVRIMVAGDRDGGYAGIYDREFVQRQEAAAPSWKRAVEVFVRDPLPPSGEGGEPT